MGLEIYWNIMLNDLRRQSEKNLWEKGLDERKIII
jgi:hypothetical protein